MCAVLLGHGGLASTGRGVPPNRTRVGRRRRQQGRSISARRRARRGGSARPARLLDAEGGEPKTKRSRRWVTVPEFVSASLAEHVRKYPPGPDGLVFTAPKGGPIRRPAFYRLVWSKATRAAGLEGFPFRNLRHTGATLALQEGTSPVLVAFRLGHASTAMIERHYGELVEGFDREIADRLAEARRRERRSPDLAPVSSLAAARRSRRRNPRKRTR